MDKVLVSTVTPVYRGEATLEELAAALAETRADWQRRELPLELTEAVFVDDGSTDGSAAVLARLTARHPWLRVITLSRNFGQHPATVAGILHTCGDWVVTLDEDLQHHPRHLATLLREAAGPGHDVVYARPAEQSVHASAFRDGSSRAFKAVLAFATDNPHVRVFSSFRALRGSVGRAAAAVAAHDAYFDVVVGWFTRRIGTAVVPMRDHRHAAGGSGYGLRKLLAHARRAVVSSQTKWLRLAALLGMLVVLASIAGGVYVLARRAVDPSSIDVRGWTSLFLLIVFFGGLSACLLGIALEYLSTLVLRAHGKPTYFIVDRAKDAVLRAALGAPPDAAPPAGGG